MALHIFTKLLSPFFKVIFLKVFVLKVSIILLISSTVLANAITDIEIIQKSLNLLGYNAGVADGIWGKNTRKALEKFLFYKGKKFEGSLDGKELKILSDELKSRGLSLDLSDKFSEKMVLSFFDLNSKQKRFIRKNSSDGTTLLRDIVFFDTNSDGIKEIFVCYSGYTNFPDIPISVFEIIDTPRDISHQLFSGNIPTTNDCPHIIFEDIDGDQDKDLILAEAGMDAPPWTGTAIEVAINKNGSFERVTQKFEDKIYGIRSYATGAHYDNIEQQGVIILGRDKILTLQSNEWKVLNNSYAWNNEWYQKDLHYASGILMKDLDNDGVEDMYVAGAFQTKNHTVFWGGYGSGVYSSLSPSKFELNQKVNKTASGIGADIVSTAVADFDNDGDLDILYSIEKVDLGVNFQISYGTSFLNLLENKGNRKFINHENPTSVELLGYYLLSPHIEDLNNDGLVDILFPYWEKDKNFSWEYTFGSVLLMNKGSLKFEAIDMKDVLNDFNRKNGIIAPLQKTNEGLHIAIINFLAGWSESVDQRVFIEKAFIQFKN